MDKTEWLSYAKEHREKIAALINDWHPSVLKVYHDMKISAQRAEKACETVRANIRKEYQGNPVVQFHQAIDSGDWQTVNRIMNDTWFGVPESKDCWKLKGFKQAIVLMEDLPEIPDGPQ